MSSIEELVFELAEEYTSGDLEKLVKLLDLVLNGKKSLETVKPVAKATAPRGRPAKAAAAAAIQSPVEDDDETF